MYLSHSTTAVALVLEFLIVGYEQHILDRLCRDIETDLRLHIHSHLEVSERDPWKNGLQDLAAILHLRHLRLFDKTIDIKSIHPPQNYAAENP